MATSRLHPTHLKLWMFVQVGGLDNYILQTKEKKLQSALGLDLKAKMKKAQALKKGQDIAGACALCRVATYQ